MVLHNKASGSQLFTVRVWVEELDGNRTEWRGRIQRVISGESFYFRDWGAMEAFVLACLEEHPGSTSPVHGKLDRGR